MPEPSAPAFFSPVFSMKTRTKALLIFGFAVLVFAGVVIRDSRATQRKADRLHAILKASRPGQEVGPELQALAAEDPDAFRTKACIRKPTGSEECHVFDFRLENDWQNRLRLAPRKIFAGRLVISDGHAVASSFGFGQGDALIAVTENGETAYFPALPPNSPVFHPAMRHFFFTPATPANERAAALDWDMDFLTSLRRVQNGQELLKSSSR